jgi:ribosomal protein S18 acetylase RimI-like enzyme
MLQARTIDVVTDAIIRSAIEISLSSYPPGWGCSNPDEYYNQKLRETSSVLITLEDAGKSVGLLVAIPQNEAVEELRTEDPEMKEDPSGYYIENIAILPSYRGKKGLSKMFSALKVEMKNRGVERISLHARISNNLNMAVRNNFKVVGARIIENWKFYNNQEPTEYIVAELNHR